MTSRERVLYHQIHPAKLSTDVIAAVISLYCFWQHWLWMALILHFLPPIVASALVIQWADLDRQRRSAFGVYVKRMMTRTVEAVRLGGDIVIAGTRSVAAAGPYPRASRGSSRGREPVATTIGAVTRYHHR